MKSHLETDPERRVTPGEALIEALQELEMSQTELSRRLGRPKRLISDIVQDRNVITADTALQLEQALGKPAAYWIELEAQREARQAQERLLERAAAYAGWLDELPVEAMVAAKWIPGAGSDAELVAQLLGWFGVASPEAWREVFVEPQASYQCVPHFDADPGVLAAWMRTGELQARTMKTSPYDRNTFLGALEQIKRLTLAPPDVWQDRMIELAAGAGVAVAFSRELAGLPVAGATRWLSPRLALIHLSLASETDDQLWLSFFHQAAHVLLHGKKQVYLEGILPPMPTPGRPPVRESPDRLAADVERAADDYAATFLVPHSVLDKLERYCYKRRPSEAIIRTFAGELHIAPGILVTRMQQNGLIAPSWLNDLKRQLGWAPPGTEADPDVY